MRKILPTICLSTLLFSTGCATVMNGPNQDIVVTSNPPGAIVTTTTLKRTQTPGTLTLPRTHSTTLTANLFGYQEAKQDIKSELSPWIFGNGVGSFFVGTVYNFFPAIAFTIVDFSTGSARQLKPAKVHFELVPTKQKRPAVIVPLLKP